MGIYTACGIGGVIVAVIGIIVIIKFLRENSHSK